MPEPGAEQRPAQRSGCAVLAGLFLIGLGLTLLGLNLGGIAFLRRAAFLLDWLSLYWPLLLVFWGAYKILQRIRAPERSRVSSLEVVGLLFFLLAGATLSAGRRGLERLSREGELEHLVEIFGPELLGPPHEFVETESFPFAVGNGRTLVIDNQRGSVRIAGWDEERIEVRVTKRLHHASEAGARSVADNVSLELASENRGSGSGSGSDDDNSRDVLRVEAPEGTVVDTELELSIPRSVPLEVRTRRGRIAIEDFGSGTDVRLRTSDADIEASRVSGAVYARTSRGAIRLSSIAGKAEAATSRGAVHARDIDGDLDARTTRAPLVAENVTGNARLENRYGSLRARRMGSSVIVDGVQCDIALESLSAGARIEANQGTVFVRDVSETVELRARRVNVQISSVGGGVVVDGSDATATLSRLSGDVSFTARRSDVRGAALMGSVTIEDAGDVELSSFASDVTVTSRHGDIRIDTIELAGNVRLDSRFGDVELTLPPQASARIQARSRNGSLETDLDAIAPSVDTGLRREGESREEGEPERFWAGVLGGGTYDVQLASEHGDLRVRLREP